MESRITGLETGADDYIIKPFSIMELKTRISNLIRKQQELRKYYSSQSELFPDTISFKSYDVIFIKRILEIIEKHMTDFDFSVKDLQEKADLSDTQLYRKLFALTGLSPSRFIRKIRITHSARQFENGDSNVTEVAFESGFANLSYFTKCFREQYGISPSEYLKQFKAK